MPMEIESKCSDSVGEISTDTAVVKSGHMWLKQLKSEADSTNDCNKQSKESLTVSVSEETKSLSAQLLKPLEVRLKTHVCSYCGQSFSSSRGLRKHRRRHSRAFSQKGKKFNQIEYFRLHPQTHIGEKPYPCINSDMFQSKYTSETITESGFKRELVIVVCQTIIED